MFTAWKDFFKSKFSKNSEFVSLDAMHHAENPRHYELKKVNGILKSPESAVTSPGAGTDYDHFRNGTPDYLYKETQRHYQGSSPNFSTPRPLSRAATQVEWDPRSTHARGGLGLHPPGFEDKF